MARLDCLPAELQIDIFNYLDTPDVKAIRRVSRTLRDFASPTLFQSIVACARYQGLGAFQNVANHPQYATYVKEIVFDGSVFIENFAKSDDIYHRAQQNFVELDTSVLRHRRDRWKRYQRFYQEQEDMKTSDVLLQTLVRASDSMPNVFSIVYSPHAHILSTERNDMRDLVPVGFTCYPTARSRRGYTTPDHAFRHLIGAIYLANFTRVRRLKVERVREKEPATEFSAEMFDMRTEVDLPAGRHLFRNLTDIELNMALRDVSFEHMVPPSQQTPSRLDQQLANLAELLATAKDLQRLALAVSTVASDETTYSHYLYLHRFLYHQGSPLPTWVKLQTLSLGGLHAHECEWSNLIKNHCGTLRSVIFRHCSMKSGFWAEVVDAIVFGSTVGSLVLDLVNEDYRHLPRTERDFWEYEGQLVVTRDGARSFVWVN